MEEYGWIEVPFLCCFIFWDDCTKQLSLADTFPGLISWMWSKQHLSKIIVTHTSSSRSPALYVRTKEKAHISVDCYSHFQIGSYFVHINIIENLLPKKLKTPNLIRLVQGSNPTSFWVDCETVRQYKFGLEIKMCIAYMGLLSAEEDGSCKVIATKKFFFPLINVPFGADWNDPKFVSFSNKIESKSLCSLAQLVLILDAQQISLYV